MTPNAFYLQHLIVYSVSVLSVPIQQLWFLIGRMPVLPLAMMEHFLDELILCLEQLDSCFSVSDFVERQVMVQDERRFLLRELAGSQTLFGCHKAFPGKKNEKGKWMLLAYRIRWKAQSKDIFCE